jgi:hypothetical protein
MEADAIGIGMLLHVRDLIFFANMPLFHEASFNIFVHSEKPDEFPIFLTALNNLELRFECFIHDFAKSV